mmetsp:Transcript_20378/g.40725  ORF Transcript_20378/g.40725 Transcript_20378/m.40725 type:complete len:347 (-) Transcript_20378:215-1255(-)
MTPHPQSNDMTSLFVPFASENSTPKPRSRYRLKPRRSPLRSIANSVLTVSRSFEPKDNGPVSANYGIAMSQCSSSTKNSKMNGVFDFLQIGETFRNEKRPGIMMSPCSPSTKSSKIDGMLDFQLTPCRNNLGEARELPSPPRILPTERVFLSTTSLRRRRVRELSYAEKSSAGEFLEQRDSPEIPFLCISNGQHKNMRSLHDDMHYIPKIQRRDTTDSIPNTADLCQSPPSISRMTIETVTTGTTPKKERSNFMVNNEHDLTYNYQTITPPSKEYPTMLASPQRITLGNMNGPPLLKPVPIKLYPDFNNVDGAASPRDIVLNKSFLHSHGVSGFHCFSKIQKGLEN